MAKADYSVTKTQLASWILVVHVSNKLFLKLNFAPLWLYAGVLLLGFGLVGWRTFCDLDRNQFRDMGIWLTILLTYYGYLAVVMA